MNWFKLLLTGKKVLNIISEYVPKALEDGKITMAEAAILITKITAVFDYNVEFKVSTAAKEDIMDVVEFIKPIDLDLPAPKSDTL